MTSPLSMTPHPSTGAHSDAYFRHHGVWAVGVRTFRNCSFASKALVISLVFALPIALLGWFYLHDKSEQIDFSQRERIGVRYLRDVFATAQQAHAVRMHTLNASAQPTAPVDPALAAAKQAFQQQLDRLSASDREWGTTLETRRGLEGMQKAAKDLASAGDGLFKVYASHAKLSQALLKLANVAADGSNLTLDPDLDTYYLMSASVLTLPRIQDAVSKMGGLAAAAALSGTQSEMVGQEMLRLDTVVETLGQQLEHDLLRVLSVHPELADQLKPVALKSVAILREEASDSPGVGGGERAQKFFAQRDAALAALGSLQEQSMSMLDGLIELRIQQARTARAMVMGSVALALLVAAYLFYGFFRVMQGGFAELRRHLTAMTSGDLTTEPSPWGRDEAAQLMLALRETQQALRTIVAQVRSQSETIVQSSYEIAGGATDLSSRAEHAAAALQQSASSIEQVSVTIKNTAEHARQAAAIASDNASVAQRGGAVMQSMVQTMGQIQESSQRIGEIIGTIDGIAFQTNILALNAAVEAARAGEHGRGFAVVASEVRALAQRSADAAREIKTLIQSSVERVESGTAIVGEAGAAIGQIVDNAAQINQLLDDISRGAAEQSGGIALVGSSVQELDQVTQHNAALAEQTAGASSTLADSASDLVQRVSLFKLPSH